MYGQPQMLFPDPRFRSPVALGTFAEDGAAAMAASPNYFLAWYSAKSILLVGVIAAFAYYVGKHSR